MQVMPSLEVWASFAVFMILVYYKYTKHLNKYLILIYVLDIFLW